MNILKHFDIIRLSLHLQSNLSKAPQSKEVQTSFLYKIIRIIKLQKTFPLRRRPKVSPSKSPSRITFTIKTIATAQTSVVKNHSCNNNRLTTSRTWRLIATACAMTRRDSIWCRGTPRCQTFNTALGTPAYTVVYTHRKRGAWTSQVPGRNVVQVCV